ncbi:hypothetical protein CYY_006001 [Polysphondylium violaceum]|uniref:Uncharacterized protein n=1 Tax=Polysphondylium violaceum TaxID=133409 RepID=A0A8J4PSY9_9MYCE|nr:hypothetical protein CYY_006001 [Polysphondylium violaceum]
MANSAEPESCYCDPSVARGFDCHEAGCRAYASVYFIFFLAITIESGRRLWFLRKNYKTAPFISLSQLCGGGLFFTIRHILLLAKVQEKFSLGFFLLFGVAFIISSYLWILIVWCNIIIQVNFSKGVQRVLPWVRYLIVFLNIALFIGFIIGVAIYWDWRATNIWIAVYVAIEAVLFFSFGYTIWKDYKDIGNISANGKMAEQTYKKVKKITKLSVYAIVSSILVAIFLWIGSMWKFKSDSQKVLYLFIQRFTLILMMVSMLVCLTLPSDDPVANDGSPSPTGSSKFNTKMKDLAFSKGDDDDDEEKGQVEEIGQSNSSVENISGQSNT